jgi:hypothetical protein
VHYRPIHASFPLRTNNFTWIHATWCWWLYQRAICTSSLWDGLHQRTHTCWHFRIALRCRSCKSNLPQKAPYRNNLAQHCQILCNW